MIKQVIRIHMINIIFSSISIILKEEGFFKSEDEEIQIVNSTTASNSTTVQTISSDNKIGLIMTLSMSVLGYRDRRTSWVTVMLLTFPNIGIWCNYEKKVEKLVKRPYLFLILMQDFDRSIDPFQGFFYSFRAFLETSCHSDCVDLSFISYFAYHIFFLPLLNQVILIIFRIVWQVENKPIRFPCSKFYISIRDRFPGT